VVSRLVRLPSFPEKRMPDILHEWCMQPKTFSFVFLVNPLRLHPQSQSNGTGLFLLLGVP
jgi:hypothetical protein